MDLTTLHRRCVTSWEERVGAVRDDQWGRSTPCTDWTVRDLVNHVTGEDLWTGPLLGGATLEEVGDRFDGDLLGQDPRRVASAAARDALGAVTRFWSPDGTVQLSYGEESMAEYLHQLAADHLIHAWDLAVATGGDTSLDTGCVALLAVWFGEREDAYRSAGIIGAPVATDGDTQDRLLAAFGRDPGWQPPG